MPVLQTGLAKSAAADYTIDQSLRFEDGDSAYLRKVFGSAGNRKTWTLSLWAKRSKLGANQALLYAGTDTFEFRFDSANNINLYQGGTTVLDTSAVYRDPSSWYHIVLALDTTVTTPSSDRVKLYVNGDQVTAFGTTNYPAEDAERDVGNAVQHTIGAWDTDDEFYGGYLAEFYFIDGTALDASSFGETDAATNQWKPIEYTGSYGTNGFYQKYSSTN